jgi:tetratricopeptide (TPR) repeat protein
MDIHDQIEQLSNRADEHPEGPVKLGFLEEAIRLADSIHDLELGFHLRLQTFYSASLSDRPHVSIAAMSWCLAQYDRNPREEIYDYLIYNYTAVIASLGNFPQVERTQLLELLDDLERRHRSVGSTLHVVNSLRRDIFLDLGDLDSAKVVHESFRKCTPDRFSMPPSANARLLADYHFTIGRPKKAVEVIDRFLESPESREDRSTEPETQLHLVYPLLAIGDYGRAKQSFDKAKRHLKRIGERHFRDLIRALYFTAFTGDYAKSKLLIAEHLPRAMKTFDRWAKMLFLRSCWLFARRLHRSGVQSIRIAMPDDCPASEVSGKRSLADLADWFRTEALEVAKLFDARNGNTWCTRHVLMVPALTRRAERDLGGAGT